MIIYVTWNAQEVPGNGLDLIVKEITTLVDGVQIVMKHVPLVPEEKITNV